MTNVTVFDFFGDCVQVKTARCYQGELILYTNTARQVWGNPCVGVACSTRIKRAEQTVEKKKKVQRFFWFCPSQTAPLNKKLRITSLLTASFKPVLHSLCLPTCQSVSLYFLHFIHKRCNIIDCSVAVHSAKSQKISTLNHVASMTLFCEFFFAQNAKKKGTKRHR